jgi:hypothetical protein
MKAPNIHAFSFSIFYRLLKMQDLLKFNFRICENQSMGHMEFMLNNITYFIILFIFPYTFLDQ